MAGHDHCPKPGNRRAMQAASSQQRRLRKRDCGSRLCFIFGECLRDHSVRRQPSSSVTCTLDRRRALPSISPPPAFRPLAGFLAHQSSEESGGLPKSHVNHKDITVALLETTAWRRSLLGVFVHRHLAAAMGLTRTALDLAIILYAIWRG